MRVGLMGQSAYSVAGTQPFDVDDLVADARSAAAGGLASYWVGQQFDWDAFTLLGAMAREVPGIELGTAVTHIWTAFPVHMAQQAASVDVLSGGRFTLGLGLEHDWVMRDMWGLPFERPVDILEEYLTVVRSLLRTGHVDFSGEHYRVRTFFSRFQAIPELQVLLGALGPRMLRLAGTVADGTMTWMTGRRTIREHIVPTIRAAAAAADRPDPRVVALIPVIVSSDIGRARQRITEAFDLYHRMPSYQAMLRREGVTTAGDTALVGSRQHVEESIMGLAEDGATDLGAVVIGDPSEEDSTRELLSDLARQDTTPARGPRPAG